MYLLDVKEDSKAFMYVHVNSLCVSYLLVRLFHKRARMRSRMALIGQHFLSLLLTVSIFLVVIITIFVSSSCSSPPSSARCH